MTPTPGGVPNARLPSCVAVAQNSTAALRVLGATRATAKDANARVRGVYGVEHNDLVLAGAVAVWFAEVRGDLPPAPRSGPKKPSNFRSTRID